MSFPFCHALLFICLEKNEQASSKPRPFLNTWISNHIPSNWGSIATQHYTKLQIPDITGDPQDFKKH